MAPFAVANVTPASGQAPLLVQFSPEGSADPDGFLEAYSWNFGDGSPISDAASPAHTYVRGGVFTATLTVTDDGGRSGKAGGRVGQSPAPDGEERLRIASSAEQCLQTGAFCMASGQHDTVGR